MASLFRELRQSQGPYPPSKRFDSMLRGLRSVAAAWRPVAARARPETWRGAYVAAAATVTAAVGSAGVAHAMRIEEEVKMDYKDVLLRPKRSTLRSRSEVEVSRTFRFRHSGREWTGVPIVVATMDTVGTFDMACTLSKHGCMVAVHKHYSVEDWKALAAAHPKVTPYVCASAGTSRADMDKLDKILTAFPTSR